MKRIILSLTLCTLSLFGEDLKSFWDYHPIHVGGNLLAIGKADVETEEGGELIFAKANAFAYFFVPISRTSFFLPRFEWTGFRMDWDRNPKFKEKDFQYLQYALTFYSMGLENWRWIARADYNMDLRDTSIDHGLFSGILWGTNEFRSKWHYHIGTIFYKGLEGREVYPLIGLDYKPNDKWFIQMIFPMLYSIDYKLSQNWKAALKLRPLKERFRTGENEMQPSSIFNYSTKGLELNFQYEKVLQLELEFFAGYNFGGKLYIKDQHGHNALYTHVKGAPYAGLSLNWGI